MDYAFFCQSCDGVFFDVENIKYGECPECYEKRNPDELVTRRDLERMMDWLDDRIEKLEMLIATQDKMTGGEQ